MQAASELAGWTRPSAGNGDVGGNGNGNGGGPGGEHPSSSGGSYPSALMQEAKGASPQGSVRRQQQQQQQKPKEQEPKEQEPSSTRVVAAAAAAGTAGTKSPKSDQVAVTTTAAFGDAAAAATSESGAAAVKRSRRVGGMSAGGTTRRWGYRRGPREPLRRNLFGRYAPVFFYPLAQVRAVFVRPSLQRRLAGGVHICSCSVGGFLLLLPNLPPTWSRSCCSCLWKIPVLCCCTVPLFRCL